MAAIILVSCAVVVLYHHIGYPMLLRWFAERARQRSWSGSVPSSLPAPISNFPTVALLVPAHNEERYIRRKAINCSELGYPSEKLTVTMALDGCKDSTEDILRKVIIELKIDIQTIVFRENQGKVSVLNAVIPQLEAEIIALSDASAILDADALKRAVSHFDDPKVGVVCGTYVMPASSSAAELAYWRYQVGIKADEALAAAPMGAHGAFYLFRRVLWKPLEADTINDDFILPMRIVAEGWNAVYDRRVVATELEAANSRQGFRRRIRIGAGNLQQTLRLWRLADLRRPALAFIFISGKALRSVMPFILLVAFAASVSLAFTDGLAARLFLAAEVAVSLLCLVGAALPHKVPRVVDLLSYWAMGYVASGLGALLLLSGRTSAAWQVSKAGRVQNPHSNEAFNETKGGK